MKYLIIALAFNWYIIGFLCSAYWSIKFNKYLRKTHPDQLPLYRWGSDLGWNALVAIAGPFAYLIERFFFCKGLMK